MRSRVSTNTARRFLRSRAALARVPDYQPAPGRVARTDQNTPFLSAPLIATHLTKKPQRYCLVDAINLESRSGIKSVRKCSKVDEHARVDSITERKDEALLLT